MATQADLDWEQYQLGQQGTATGSGMNQMGLSDRPRANSYPSHDSASKTRKQSKTAAKPKAKKAAQASKTSEGELEFFFGFIAFVVVGLNLYQPASQNEIATLIVAGIAGLVVGKLYKVILAGLLIFGIVYMLAYMA